MSIIQKLHQIKTFSFTTSEKVTITAQSEPGMAILTLTVLGKCNLILTPDDQVYLKEILDQAETWRVTGDDGAKSTSPIIPRVPNEQAG